MAVKNSFKIKSAHLAYSWTGHSQQNKLHSTVVIVAILSCLAAKAAWTTEDELDRALHGTSLNPGEKASDDVWTSGKQ